jgi:polysaccharide biosynthesis protein VpsQ
MWIAFLLFLIFLAAIIYWADRGVMPGIIARLYAFPNGDKVGHFVLMFLLALLANWAFAPRRPSERKQVYRRAIWVTLLVIFAVTLEEISQLWFAHRTFSLGDLASSLVGILFGSLAAVIVYHRKHKLIV